MPSPAAVRLSEVLSSILSNTLEKSPSEFLKLLEKPKSIRQGDWALPCFQFLKPLQVKAPPLAAQRLFELTNESPQLVENGVSKVEVAGPYLNFFLDRTKLANATFPKILSGEFLKSKDAKVEKKDKTMIEYSQPNTHKAFHVGHLRNAALGDSIRRLMEWNGHEVIPVNYIGDEGAHVAKCLWHFRYIHGDKPVPKDHLGEFLGDQYTKGTEMQNLDSYTLVAKPGVVAALVKSIEPHPKHEEEVKTVGKKDKVTISKPYKNWKVCKLASGSSEMEFQVVTGASGFEVGDMVAYAGLGIKFDKKILGVADKAGTESHGMILSEKEMGFIPEENQKIAVLPKTKPSNGEEVKVGEDVTEIYRHKVGDPKYPYAITYDQNVMDVFNKRKGQCSEILQAIEKGDGNEIYKQWEETKEWSMQEFKRIYKWIDARFDDWFFESEYGETSKALVREFLVPNEKDSFKGKGKEGVFVESQGAVGADLKKHYPKQDLGNFCLLIKSDGTALYATRDLALAQKKFEKYGVEKSLYIVDDAQTLHFQQVFKCLDLMGYEQAAKCKHLGYAQVVLKDGKMSSRKGNVILFSTLERDLVATINKDFLAKFENTWSKEQMERAAHVIALASMRYGMLNQDAGSQIVFDLEAWCNAKGNTGPYLLYAFARTQSILNGLKESLKKNDQTEFLTDLEEMLKGGNFSCLSDKIFIGLKHETEQELIGLLADFPEVLEKAADTQAPVEVCRYLYGLAKTFSQWFQVKECSVLHAEGDEVKKGRAVLVGCIAKTLKIGLGLIGIPTLDKM